jgi:solute carrier family 25 (mitochondrial S-adenosylmethionine transporter), member 26
LKVSVKLSMSHNNTSGDIWIVSADRRPSISVLRSKIHKNWHDAHGSQAGAFAAFTVDLFVYPLDTLKTRLQSPDYARLYTHQPAHNGSSSAAAVVNRAALFRGLYQGVGSVILATLPSSGAFFTTYEGVKHALSTSPSTSSSTHLPQPAINAAASATAELVSCAILTPAEVVKQNAQMVGAAAGRNATIETLAKFRSNPLALWRGYTALAGRNLPFTALQFPLFEKLREVVRARRARGRKAGEGPGLVENGLVTAGTAGSAGAVAAVVTTPVDVVKTRIMLAAVDGDGGSGAAKKTGGGERVVDALGREKRAKQGRKSGWAVGKEIYAQQGVRGLFRGGALRGVWTMLGSGLYLGVYESGRVYLARRRGQDVDEDELFWAPLKILCLHDVAFFMYEYYHVNTTM